MSVQSSTVPDEIAPSPHGTADENPTGAKIPVATLASPSQKSEPNSTATASAGQSASETTNAVTGGALAKIKPFIGPIVVTVAVLIGVAFVWNRLTSLRNHHQQQVENVHGSPAPERPRFSLSHFAQLRDGMTYAEVCKILGDNGVDRLRSNSAKFVGWENSDGSFIQVGFQDKATTLLQVGLN